MKVIVFGATGGLGQYIWKALLKGGHEVVAFVRTPSKIVPQSDLPMSMLSIVQGNVMDAQAVQQAAKGCQVVVNCTSPATGNSTLDLAKAVVLPILLTNKKKESPIPSFYMVGGLGALWAPNTNKTILMQDWDDVEAMTVFGMPMAMPKERIQAMTKGHLQSMAFLASVGNDGGDDDGSTTSAVPHTYLCPGFMVDGEATTTRVVSLDEIHSPKAMKVSFGNIAQAIADDIGKGELLGHRVCVSDS